MSVKNHFGQFFIVGGGAINATLVVLSFLGLPVELVAILLSVDFIIDMGRTLVNVSDSIVAGYVTGKLEHDIDEAVLHDEITLEEAEKRGIIGEEQLEGII